MRLSHKQGLWRKSERPFPIVSDSLSEERRKRPLERNLTVHGFYARGFFVVLWLPLAIKRTVCLLLRDSAPLIQEDPCAGL